MRGFRRLGLGVVSGLLGALFTTHCAAAREHPAHPYRYSVVDMPVSLAVGTVRTPGFVPPKDWWYWILVQVEKPLPFADMECLVGVGGSFTAKRCAKEQLIVAEWTVLSDGQAIAHGSSSGFGLNDVSSSRGFSAAKYTAENIFKFIGSFPTRAGKAYVVEVRFSKDGTPLNIANPHLIIVRQGLE